MNDRERITRLEIRCEQLQLTVNEAFHWIDILKSDLSDLQDRVGQADRKTEPQRACSNCKNKGFEGCEQPCLGCGWCDAYEPKDEPQTEYSIGYYTPTNAEILKALEDEQSGKE